MIDFERMDELALALRKSVAIQTLWPGVGKTVGWWTGFGISLKFHIRCVETDMTRVFDRPVVPKILRNPKAEADALKLMSNPIRRAQFEEGKI
jgi:hypothetical protein